MLTLSTKIPITKSSIEDANLLDRLSPDDRTRLGEWVWEGYDRDLVSRANWFRRNEAGLDLAMQILRAKNFPWAGCSNVAFPLVTIAVMQFHSRAYPELIPGKEVVQYEVWGDDPDGSQARRAERIGLHMSHQCMKEDTAWEEQHDKLLMNYSIVGSAFIKTKHSSSLGVNCSEFVPARDLVMDYYTKKTETSRRKTHIIPLDRNQIHERMALGSFIDVSKEAWYNEPAPMVPDDRLHIADKDNRAGLTPPYQSDELTPFTFLEQHTYLDLDQDGYAEPVILTIEPVSRTLVRMVYRFERLEDVIYNTRKEILRVNAEEAFTRFEFIPSPDGGIYGMGWGLLLGPINESVNSAINQLIDAGTMSNAAGGFLARGAKMRGGAYQFGPFMWHTVDVGGQGLKDSMLPLPVREPSQVLFNLLSLLVDYANRISASTEMLVGENPGQNTPAQTSQTMVEEGMRIFTAIFKRAWRSLKEEFEKRYVLNAIHMKPGVAAKFPGGLAAREDYLGDPSRVAPSADPTTLSDTQRLRKAVMVKQAAMTTPGYDLAAVERNFLRASRVPGWQQLYLGADKVPPLPNPKMQVEQMKMQLGQLKLKAEKMKWAATLLEQVRLDDAKIEELKAKAAMEIAQAGGVKAGHQIAAFEAAIGAMRVRSDAMLKHAEILLKEAERGDGSEGDGDGVGGVAGKSRDPSGATDASAMAAGVHGAVGNGSIPGQTPDGGMGSGGM